MALVIGSVVAALAIAGFGIFQFQYRGARARWAGLSAFAVSIAVIAVFILIHGAIGPDHAAAQPVFFTCHVAMCVAELLLLGAVMGLRDPPSPIYTRVETVAIGLLSLAALIFYGVVAWRRPEQQDDASRFVFYGMPLLISIAIYARFGVSREGLVGVIAFVSLFVSNLTYLYIDHFGAPYSSNMFMLIATSVLPLAGYIGLLLFFSLTAGHASLLRTPWPGGSLKFNAVRGISAAVLVLGLTACGGLYSVCRNGHTSAYASWTAICAAAAFAACLVGVYGLTTGRTWRGS
jgi:hypothetical protein